MKACYGLAASLKAVKQVIFLDTKTLTYRYLLFLFHSRRKLAKDFETENVLPHLIKLFVLKSAFAWTPKFHK